MAFTDDTEALRNAAPDLVADALGLTPDEQAQKEKGGAGYLYYAMRDGQKIVICTKSRSGAPLWWRPGDAAHAGDWFALVQHLQPGLNLGQAKAHLRRALGSMPAPVSMPTPAPTTPAPAPVLADAPTWAAQWLAGRGLSARAIRLALDAGMAGVAAEAKGGRFCNLAFPHTDGRSDLIGAEIRGQGRAFKGFQGRKGVFLLPALEISDRLCVVESAIDALALLDFMHEHGKGAAWVMSTAGRPSAAQTAEIESLARDLGIRRLVACQDGDEGGDEQSAAIEALAGRMGAEYKRTRPPTGCKDWSDWAEGRNIPAAA
ncbi:MAG: toprim domain-containing protein [Thiomonas arsenitoxydans]|uniref:Toprim domain-containing protein n=1 Tax=Thiomonas arsenitoxydans (strain DSM 22701 / CIP 110005 / 3As) TaxID=426114 RepID=A0A8I1MY35_THIA3|nr:MULTISPECIES: toprim domain-containing protein [Thiomonas]MBN8745781.1 toprim domain-containing protein [Thiomonas arsenitoxydans]ODU96288.1 MAG: hypothetical protein ABT24_09490 [Thiomonas sp. SCN 64-16]